MVAALSPWPSSGVARVEARITAKEMMLLADGDVIAQRDHTLSAEEIRSPGQLTIGSGIYGESEVAVESKERNEIATRSTAISAGVPS